MIVLIDMDDVITDFDGEFYRRWKLKYPDKYITPPSQRSKFYLKEESPPEYKEFITSIYTEPGFIRGLPPVDGAIEALKTISKEHTVFICTTPLDRFENCVLEKYYWILDHIGFDWTKRLILTKDKTLIKGDILIDDKPEIIGNCTPQWEHVLFDKPYNRHINNKKRINWNNYKHIFLNSC